MTIRSTTLLQGAIGAAVIVALASAPAVAGGLDEGAVDCRASIAKAYSKLVGTAIKSVSGCHKSRNAGKIPANTDCNTLAGADAKSKIEGAALKLRDAITANCTGEEGDLFNSSFYLECPVPCQNEITNPINTIAELGTCLSCVGPAEVFGTTQDALGAPTPGETTLTKDDQKCAGAIAKSYGKVVTTLLKSRYACQGGADEAMNNSLTICSTNDDGGKGAAALAKAEEAIDKSCAAADLENVGACYSYTPGDLKDCLEQEYEKLALDAFTTAYELPTQPCPTGVRTLIRAGESVDGDTDSTLSVGWSGLGHDIDIVDKYSISANLDCPGTATGSCGECTIEGISVEDPQYTFYSRCIENPAIPCKYPFGTDPDCPGSANCGYYLGPPLPVSAGGTPTCTVNRMFANVTGTADPDAGTSQLNVDLRAVVHLGGSQTLPCAVCEDDTTAQDGSRDGVCTGGHPSVNGLPCDVQAFDLSFSTNVPGLDPVSGLSLDCPPHQTQNFSGTGLIIDLELSTGTSSLPFSDACDGGFFAFDCACGVCSGDGATPCETDLECSTQALGNCGQGGGVARKPNGCANVANCVAGVETDRGTCSDTIEEYCDGFVRANGRGVVTCSSTNNPMDPDADCASVDCNGDLPGTDCGACAVQNFKSCFLDPIQVTGTPDTENPVLAGVFCLPPTSNTGINSAAGSPGPGLVKVDALVDKIYD